jgi:hypothetical protein
MASGQAIANFKPQLAANANQELVVAEGSPGTTPLSASVSVQLRLA